MNDNDDYITIEDDDESYDSDKIDSDIEAELYSSIHHKNEFPSESQDNKIKHNHSISIISEKKKAVRIEDSFLSDGVSDNSMYLDFGTPNKNTNSARQDLKNSNASPKRKSTMIANILNNIQSPTEFPNKKLKTAKQKRKFQSVMSTDSTIDDSDSDSVIFIDSGDLSELQTNIAIEIHDVSSDSDKSTVEDKFASLTKNHFLNCNSVGNSNGDPWYINKTDLFRTKKASNRYHASSNSSCTNCNKKGHSAKYCLEVKALKCCICGDRHIGARCEAQICTRCFGYGHDKWHCFIHADPFCRLCSMPGHGERNCPDLWRRYHLTTSGKKIVKGRREFQDTTIYCFNCGLQGHFGYNCPSSQKARIYPVCPYVISYENPKIPFNDIEKNDFPIQHNHMWNQPNRPQKNKNNSKKSRKKKQKEAKQNIENKTVHNHNSPVKNVSKMPKSPQVQNKKKTKKNFNILKKFLKKERARALKMKRYAQ